MSIENEIKLQQAFASGTDNYEIEQIITDGSLLIKYDADHKSLLIAYKRTGVEAAQMFKFTSDQPIKMIRASRDDLQYILKQDREEKQAQHV